jgi:hypothetical protein
MKNRLCITMLCLLAAVPVFPQAQDPAQFIGITLSDLITRFGAPKSVYPVRGADAWQDDVVFVYDNGEFFVYGNRVWQFKSHSAYGIKNGDSKNAVSKALGAGTPFEGYSLFQLPGKAWPMMLRVNWDAGGRVSGIYIYRSDF